MVCGSPTSFASCTGSTAESIIGKLKVTMSPGPERTPNWADVSTVGLCPEKHERLFGAGVHTGGTVG